MWGVPCLSVPGLEDVAKAAKGSEKAGCEAAGASVANCRRTTPGAAVVPVVCVCVCVCVRIWYMLCVGMSVGGCGEGSACAAWVGG